jgi:AcrR family transcriptional regulator
MSAKTKLGRRPGPTSTRPVILDAALSLFAERGYERATIRAIAARAGVDPATVLHHFPSKQDLLASTLRLPVDPPQLLDTLAGCEPGQEGKSLLGLVLATWEAPEVRLRLTALLRIGLSHQDAAEALRNLFQQQLITPLAKLIGGPDAELRAALVASQMSGLALLRLILGIEQVANANTESLTEIVGANLQNYISNDPGSSASADKQADGSL